MAYNKIIVDNVVKLDLTQDDVLASDVAKGKKFHTRDGESAVGTNTFDADTSDADAIASEILDTKIAYVKGAQIVGTMPNNGGVTGNIADITVPYTIPSGYHDGSGTVEVEATEKAKLIPTNIKAGVNVLGVVGTYGGEAINVQSKTVTPTFAKQTILPDSGYDYLSQVEVDAIPIVETPNSAGGMTINIG